jgi:hypothetical protein
MARSCANQIELFQSENRSQTLTHFVRALPQFVRIFRVCVAATPIALREQY